MGKRMEKPNAIRTREDCEQALAWIDVKLDSLNGVIRISNRANFSPKKWKQKLTGFLWARQCTQGEDHVVASPWLDEVSASACEDAALQDIEFSSLLAYAREIEAVVEERCSQCEIDVKRGSAAAIGAIDVDQSNTLSMEAGDREAIRSHDEEVLRNRLAAALNAKQERLSEWKALLGRAQRTCLRVNDAVLVRKEYTRANYCRQASGHLKWAKRKCDLSSPYLLPGILGKTSDVKEA